MLFSFLSVIFLLSFNNEVARLLETANELGMMNGEYAFVTLDFTIDSHWIYESWAGGRSKEEFTALFDGIVNLSVKGPHGDRYDKFVKEFREKLKANNVSEIAVVSIAMNCYQICRMIHGYLQFRIQEYWRIMIDP